MKKGRGRRRRAYRTLAAYLKATGIRQVVLAKRVGTSQANLSRILAGRAVPRPALALRITRATGVPLESFPRAVFARQAAELGL